MKLRQILNAVALSLTIHSPCAINAFAVESASASADAWSAASRDYLSQPYAAAITEVRVDDDFVRISGNVPDLEGTLAIAEFSLSADNFLTDGADTRAKPLWVSEPLSAPGAFTIEVARKAPDGNGERNRLLSKWCIVRAAAGNWELASHAHYADDVAPRADLPAPALRHKKGLGGFSADRGFVSDLDDLDVACVTVNIPLTFLRSEAGPGRTAHRFGGQTFFVDDASLAHLDRTLRETASRDIVVLAILLVPPPGQFPDPAMGALMPHPDYEPPGIFAMPNVNDDGGLMAYAAAVDVLADRYARPGSPFGRIHHWIVHNEVDAGKTWTNAGGKSVDQYVDLYHKSLRAVQLVARQYDKHAVALASFTHSWIEPSEPEGFSVKTMLDQLIAWSRAEGDFPWGLAYHPYPQSLFEPATWRDEGATFAMDTPNITFKNIEVLVAWARRRQSQYLGQQPRAIHLTEQGFNSRDYGDDALRQQAAAMAYAWKKIADLPEINSMEYHNWIDNRAEGGLRIGLRKFPDDADDPGGKKPIWDVFRALGTPDEDRACAFALPVVGVDAWDQVILRGAIGDAANDAARKSSRSEEDSK
jgi:hypothetical protein